MAQDPLTSSPVAATHTPASVPPPAPGPVRDFKKIILRQTARKFTARPPPPRRPWPKPNYYCDYDSQEPITSSLFSSDVVFSKSVVESLFFNTRYVKGSTSSSSEPSFLNGTVRTLRYGVQNNGVTKQDDDDDIQIIAHIKPSSQSQTLHLNHLTPTTLANGTATKGQGKSKSTTCAKPRSRSRPSTKKDKAKAPLSLIHINGDGTGALPMTAVDKKPGKQSPKSKTKKMTQVTTPPKIPGLNSSNSTKIFINGYSPTDAKTKTPKKKLPEKDEESSPSFPTHLWSLPSLAWTQAPTPATMSPGKTKPATRAGEATPKKMTSNGATTQMGKKRPPECLSPSLTKSKGFDENPDYKLSPTKKLCINGINTHLSSQLASSQSPATKKKRSETKRVNFASIARSGIAKVSTPNNTSRKNSRARTTVAVRCVKGASSMLAGLAGSGEINDKNNNTFSQSAVAAVAEASSNEDVPRSETKAEITRVKKPKQTKINGIFKVAKKNPTAVTANPKSLSKNRIHASSIANNATSTGTEVQIQANGPRQRSRAPNSHAQIKQRAEASPQAKITNRVPGAINLNVTASGTATSPSHPCNKTPPLLPPPSPTTRSSRSPCKNRPNAQAQPEVSNPKPHTGLPVLADTRISLVARPMTTEAPIDYSLKTSKPHPRERTPEPETRMGHEQTSTSNKSTRTLRITPTKSYAYLTKRSCPCDCSASH